MRETGRRGREMGDTQQRGVRSPAKRSAAGDDLDLFAHGEPTPDLPIFGSQRYLLTTGLRLELRYEGKGRQAHWRW